MRLQELVIDQLKPDQRAVMEQIFEGPRRAQMSEIGLVGPFDVFVRAPALGGPAQALGAAVRYRSSLPDNVKEVAICTVGHFHRARFEFAAHQVLAITAGVSADALERLRTDLPPGFEGAEGLAHRVALALLETHRIPAALYASAIIEFGEQGLIELVLTVGYYCLISHTLNAFEVPLTERMTDPYPGDLPA